MIEGSRETVIMTLGRVFELRPVQAEKLFTEVMQCMRKRDLVSSNVFYTTLRLDCIYLELLHQQSLHDCFLRIKIRYGFSSLFLNSNRGNFNFIFAYPKLEALKI